MLDGILMQGFICVSSVTKGSAADRCGIGRLLEEAKATNYLLLISRLEGKSVIPSNVSSTGLINCCDQAEIRSTLVSVESCVGLQHFLFKFCFLIVVTSTFSIIISLQN